MVDRLTDAELMALNTWAVDHGGTTGLLVMKVIGEVREHRAARTLTTYRMADGSDVWGEFAWVCDIEYFESADPPVEVMRERWALVESETLTLPEEADRG